MGDVVSMNSPRQHKEITGAKFEAALPAANVRVRDRIARITGIEVDKIHEGLMIAPVVSAYPYGTVHYAEIKPYPDVIVASSPHFPMYLQREQRMSTERSIELAADYVTAFSIFIAGVKWRERLAILPNEGLEPSVWPIEYRNVNNMERSNMLQVKALPYRVAGGIALDGVQLMVEPQSIPPEGLPPHIAGLHNPLDEANIRLLNAVFKAPGTVQ